MITKRQRRLAAKKEFKLPPGNWQPVNWLDKISEDEAKGLVNSMNGVIMDRFGNTLYTNYKDVYHSFITAKESLLSLLESDEEAKVWKNIYLLKRI